MSSTHPRRFLLKTGYRCNNNCLYCHASPHRGFDATSEDLERRIAAAASQGARNLVLSGGEPTIREDLPDILQRIVDHGMTAGLVTNGRMLTYARLRARLLDAPIVYLQISIPAATATIHDTLVGVEGAWHQTVTGLTRLLADAHHRRARLQVTVNCVVTKTVLSELDGMADLMNRLAQPIRQPIGQTAEQADIGLRLKFSCVEPEGRALDHFNDVVPAITRATAAIAATAERWSDQLGELGVSLCQEGFPACLLPKLPLSDLWTEGFLAMSEAFEDEWHPIDDRNRARPADCAPCSRDACPGLYRTYLDRRSGREVRPEVQLRSNSFVYHNVDSGDALSNQPGCPVPSNLRDELDPFSRVVTFEEKTWLLWSTDNADFSKRELAVAVQRDEQVYRFRTEAPTKGREGLFAHLDKLVLSDVCRSCDQRPTCGGWFIPSHPDVLTLDEQWIEHILADIRGNVIDMGCGQAPYLKALLPAIEAGLVDYLGVDPQPTDRRHGPGLTFVTADADSWDHPALAERTDQDVILCIRSLPHFPNPASFFSQAFDHLNPGGRLIVISDTAFGVLGQETDHGGRPPTFEHYRNLTLDRTIPIVRAVGFEVTTTRATGPQTSPLFLVEASKPKR